MNATTDLVETTNTTPLPPPAAALDEWLKVLAAVAALVVKLALFLGVLITLAYCWLLINFFPSGLTIGDSLFFLAIAFAYGLLHLLMCALGVFVMEGLLRPLSLCWPKLREFAYATQRTEQKDRLDRWMDTMMLFILVVASVAGLGLVGILARSWIAALILVPAGFMLWLLRIVLRSPRVSAGLKLEGTLLLGGFGLVVIPVVIGQPLARWQVNTVMEAYAVRGENRSVRLSDENHATLAAAAQAWQIPLNQCDGASTGGSRVVHGVNLVWHGVGERSLVSIADPKDATRSAVVELKRDGVFAIRGPQRVAARCAVTQPPPPPPHAAPATTPPPSPAR